MRIAVQIAFGLYGLGFVAMFLLHTQMPATLGLALIRSAAWPVSIIRHDLWPRGTPLPMD